jgi:hypothetical protein
MSTLQQTVNKAHCIARDAGIALSPSRINKVVRRAWHDNPTLTDADLMRCISYADPTGETAVRNAMRRK